MHQITTELIKREPSFISMEDLNVKGMMKNKHLSKAIQEQSFYEFRRQICYKGEWNGSTKYVKYNFVTYESNGLMQTFECLRDDTPLGTLPTNTTYWAPRVIRGEQGESGLGLTPRGIWNAGVQYYKDDKFYNVGYWEKNKFYRLAVYNQKK